MINKLIKCISFIVFAFYNNSVAQDLTIPKKNYEDTISFKNAPKRISDKLPLSDQSNKDNWKLIKQSSDEFKNKSLNLSKWYSNNPTWKGRAPTLFEPSNVRLENGNLVISLNKHSKNLDLPEGFTHTTGFVRSIKPVLYGYFEAKLKPIDANWVTGFWLSNHEKNWWTEIDICENAPGVKGNEHNLNSNVHVFKSPINQGNITKHFDSSQTHYLPFELQKDYHIWGLDWNEKYIRFYIDGVLFREVENKYWHQPLYININCESNKWFKALPPGDNDRITNEYNINYVRVWQKKSAVK